MKLTRTLLAAVAVSAFAVPAAAQDPAAPAATPPVAPATTAPAEQPMIPPANPTATDAPAQPGPMADPVQQPTTQTAPAAPAQAATATSTPIPATAADLVAGAQVLDQQGQPVGTIETADATGAVVSTGNARGRLNLDAFYKNERGLLIGYSRAQFEGLVSGLGGPETPDAEESQAPAADPAPAVQPEAVTPPATAPETPEAPE